MKRARLVCLSLLGLGAACGTRTGLLVEDDRDASVMDAAPRDSGHDVHDVGIDHVNGFDAARPDVLPVNDCPDADSTLIYVITDSNELLSFYPPSLEFKSVGTIACPAPQGTSPFSMGVSRKGTAFVVFSDGNLYEVSTATASCKATSFKVGQGPGSSTFGMAFAGDQTSESLYVAPDSLTTATDSEGLATIDTTTFKLDFIAPFNPTIPGCELSGTGDGRLFAYWPDNGSGAGIAQIDRATAAVTGIDNLKVGTNADAFAFAFWGGEFWIFTAAPPSASSVTQFDPSTLIESTVTSAPGTIVGAGVSTCAPQ